jgi:3D (Asp-Asp-Asp) domain-containing protein/LysM repeat protein
MGGKTMFKTIKTLIAVAALSGTVAANVQAKEVTDQKGDTLWELSQVNNASVENIQKWNQLASDLIDKADILKIATKKQYTVKQGDTLFSIANENNVSTQNLIDWNNLYTNLIHQGLNLVIFEDPNTTGKMAPVKQEEASTTEMQQASSTNATAPSQAGSQVAETSSTSELVNTITHQDNAPKPVNNSLETSVQAEEPAPTPTPSTVQVPTPAPTPTPAPSAVQAPTPGPPAAPASTVTQSDAPKEITVKATAYTADCEGCSGITKTGVNLKANPDEKVIAVDPSVIPLGSKVYIEGYGEATAADTGGAIKGNRIDVYMQNESDALQFGAKEITVKILN